MANIVEKYPFVGTTGQCLILDTRERLMYPFNLGNYTEVRAAIYYSYTRVTGNNLEVFEDTATKSSPQTNFFWGFSNYNTGANILPGMNSGLDYAGASFGSLSAGIHVLEATNSWIQGGNASNSAYFNVDITNITGASNTISSSGPLLNYFPTKATGASNYFGMLGIQFRKPSANQFSIKIFGNEATYGSNSSTANLRSDINSLGTNRSSAVTGFFTSGCTNNSNILSLPNTLLIYNPMLNSRMRIHNLVVERYE